MTKKIKMPLSVHVLFHKDNEQGRNDFKDIYHLLCRNPNDPLTDGLDIPVYLYTGGDGVLIPQIKYEEGFKNVIIILVDHNMYCCPDWKKYIDELFEDSDINKLILPVALFEYAFDISTKLKMTQFIRLKTYSIHDNWSEFKMRLFDSLIRFLKDKSTKKLQLFISHSKKDSDELGKNKAEELREYLRRDTKLDSFFDANEIQDGYDFGKQIKDNLEDSLLVILKTNTYSEREWCRIEALVGKNNMLPTIAVSLINGEVKRNFPYLGNVPLIRYDENWSDVINLLLRTALNQYHQKALLDILKTETANLNFEILPFTPELFSFSILSPDTTCVLYPEPPLGTEEIDLLRKLKNEIRFLTPMQIHTELCHQLKDKNIAISISESEDIEEYGADITLLNDMIIELSRHILVAGGKLLYGGDLRKQGFTELFKDLSCQYGHSEKSDSDTTYFTNYFAWPIHLNLSVENKLEYKYSRVKLQSVEVPQECPPDLVNTFVSPSTPDNLYLWAKSLTKMRKAVCEKADAYIVLGGRLSGFKGKYPGILEEFLIAQRNKKPIYLLGGFGGASKAIVDILEGSDIAGDLIDKTNQTSLYSDLKTYYNQKEAVDVIDYNQVVQEIKNNGISSLNNRLTEEENRILFSSTNVLEIIILVMKGLNEIFKK